jgi:ABC-type transport system involved in Fe-S cluster assembly fused permease/ATPase subunit
LRHIGGFPRRVLVEVRSNQPQTYNYGSKFAVVTAVTMAAYAVFTIVTTSWRTKFRKQMNSADNKGATVAVDSLINYEAVKVGLMFLSQEESF